MASGTGAVKTLVTRAVITSVFLATSCPLLELVTTMVCEGDVMYYDGP
jgi:hypothetical protein